MMLTILDGWSVETLIDVLQVADEPTSKWGWYLVLFFTSFVKFSIAAITALAEPTLSIWEFFLTVGGGAVASVFFFTYFGDTARRWIMRWRKRKPKAPDKNNRYQQIWNRVGLPGVALLAPFLSPIASVAIAVSFKERPARIILFTGLSVILWTILFALIRSSLIQWALQAGIIS
ncbi:MAG: hypothetical protein AAFQ83_19485 [Bacteroidota bacterium]